jgi:SAM-dependent methyltransferase
MQGTLPMIRRRYPAFHWRLQNTLAYVDWRFEVLLRDWFWEGERDFYDDSFWDSHAWGDWDGLADAIVRHTNPRSLLDVGCGQGKLLEAFQMRYPGLPVAGTDYSPAALRRARSRRLRVVQMDVIRLSPAEVKHFDVGLPEVDVAVCLEVAEHIPAWHVGKLLRFLSRANKIVFSAAHPNQGGDHHVNEQPMSYWRQRLRTLGYRLAEMNSAFRRNVAQLHLPTWYQDNVQLFCKQ